MQNSRKKSTDELWLIALKIDAKFNRKLTCFLKTDMNNLTYFQRLKNSDFILESKMEELNQNKNSEQPDRLYTVEKLYFILEINE